MSDPLEPGSVIAGKFRVERLLGRGGMGFVLEATNIQLQERFALKFLTKGADDPETRERFTREARAAVKLRSEHVARVYDVGDDPTLGPFIVMELLDGPSLAEVIAQSGRVPIQRAAEYVIDACEGLSEAHARGLVHRDIKPANLLVSAGNDGKPTVKVLDFGLARTAHDPASRPSTYGSPHYLAPEQIRASASIDRRADVWSLGCVLFELVTGEKAFQAERLTELVAKILEQKRTPVPPGVDLPAPLLAIVDRCLAIDPAERFGTTAELAVALLSFARRRAHAIAARAVARAREAGLAPHLEMPASVPPAASTPPIDLLSSQSLRAPRVPEISMPSSEAELSPTPVPASDVAAPKTRRSGVAVAAIGAIALLGALLFVLIEPPGAHAPAPAPTDSAPTESLPTESAREPLAPTAAPGAAAAAVAPTPTTPAAPAPAESTATRITRPSPSGRPVLPAAGRASASSPSPSKTLDIEHHR